MKKEEITKIIKQVGLTKAQATQIYGDIEKKYQKLLKDMSYSAPEVIKQRIGEFFWNIYLDGRISEKEEIIKKLENLWKK